jgi:nicotinamidase-related amidase
MKAALLVVDMQKEFFQEEGSRPSLMEAVPYINYSIDIFRKAGCPVIFVQDKETTEEGFEVYEGLKVEPTDARIAKEYGSAFWKTELEELLHKQGIEMVAICGYAAEYCVHATYNGAMERDFVPTLIQRAIAGPNPQHIGFIQNICRTTSIMVLDYFLNGKE